MRRGSHASQDNIKAYLAELDRVCFGEATPEDRAHVEAWLATHPEEQEIYRQLMTGLQRGRGQETSNSRVDARVEAILRRSVRARKDLPRNTSSLGRSISWKQSIQVAAVGAVLAVAGIAFGIAYSSGDRQLTQSYITHAGERARIRLPEGTLVQLGPQSVLAIDALTGSSRTVRLSGEAHFDVNTHATVPFMVRTGDASIRVLGTTFTVRYYATDSGVRVSVESGKVSSARHGHVVTLTAGQMATLADSAARVEAATSHSYTDWTRGQLVFKEENVAALLNTVGRWYGYRFKLADSALANQHVSVTLHVADSSDMMVALKDVLDVTMTVDGNVITLHPRQHPGEQRVLPPPAQRFSPSTEMGR